MNVGAAQGVAVREFQTASGPVDYALFVDRRLCGVIEAKPEGTTLSGFSDQAERYMEPDLLRPIVGQFAHACANAHAHALQRLPPLFSSRTSPKTPRSKSAIADPLRIKVGRYRITPDSRRSRPKMLDPPTNQMCGHASPEGEGRRAPTIAQLYEKSHDSDLCESRSPQGGRERARRFIHQGRPKAGAELAMTATIQLCRERDGGRGAGLALLRPRPDSQWRPS